jgi:hypothetical protein
MHIDRAIAIVSADAAIIGRYIERRERFLDALDWSAMTNRDIHESAMMDALLESDAAEADCYRAHLAELAAVGIHHIDAVLRFRPFPRPWHPEWTALAN